FDPWGKRRVATNWNDFGSPGVFMTNTYLARGYTGHEHLDHLGLIHMNGRVYDPELGRFLSADPNIQFPESTQGFNRYTYVGNNPMSYSDPSGFFIKKLMKIASFAMNFAPIPGLGTIANGFVQGFLASGGDIKAGFFGAVSAGLASGIGESNAKLFGSELLGKGALHGISQGAITTAGGGRFGDGFLGAFASKMLSPLTEKIAGEYQTGDSNDIVARAAVSAAIGGTASKLGGGKFSNGALSASFVSVYNGDDFGSFLDVADPVLRFLSDSGVPDVASTLQDAVDESIAETSETLEHLAEASEPEVTVSGSGRLGTMNGSVSVSLDPDGYSTSVEGGMATLPKNPKDYIDLELLVDASANIYRTAPPPPSDAYPVKIGFSGDAGYFGIRIYRQSWYGENGVPTGRWVVRGRVGNPQFGAGMAVSN
ncbi:MAG: RHS repeat-associated core domain-containing protein, partial [Pseudomonadota bacterium]